MHRGRLSALAPVHCRTRYTWNMLHYNLCYSSCQPGSTRSSLREQPYLTNVRTFFTVTQVRSLCYFVPLHAKNYRCSTTLCTLTVRSPFRFTPAQPSFSILVKPALLFTFLRTPCSLFILIPRRSPSPLLQSVFSILARFIQPRHNEQQLFKKRSRL